MSKLTIEIGAKIDALQRGLANARSSLNGFAKSVNDSMSTGAKAGIAAIGAGVAYILQKSIQLSAAMEQTKVAFEVMTGSADKARGLIDSLIQFSNATPFKSDEVLKSAKVLMAFGGSIKDVLPTLRMLGDVSAGTGKDLQELSVIYGQIRSAGRLMGQDLLQLVNAGFNPLTIISKQTGKSMIELKKDMEAGLISFEMVEAAFKSATSAGGLFFQMTEKQSQTLNGQLSTLADSMERIGVGIGDTFLEDLKALTKEAIGLAGAFEDIAAAKKLIDGGGVEADLAGPSLENLLLRVAKIGMKGLPITGALGALGIDNPAEAAIDKRLDTPTGGISAPAATAAEIEKANATKVENAAAEKATADEAAATAAAKSASDAAEVSLLEDRAWAARAEAAENVRKFAEEEEAKAMKAAAEFGVQGMVEALESQKDGISKNMEAVGDENAELTEQARDLEKTIGSAFQPERLIQSDLARIGGERTISIDRNMPQTEMDALKKTNDQLKANNEQLKLSHKQLEMIEAAIKAKQKSVWPGGA